jgi:hypothetical protein
MALESALPAVDVPELEQETTAAEKMKAAAKAKIGLRIILLVLMTNINEKKRLPDWQQKNFP